MSKHTKDFNAEERQIILKQAEEFGLQEAARMNDTTWQAVRALQRIEAGDTEIWQNRKKFTQEEREAIWARANEVGFEQAAAENGISAKTLQNWQWKFGFEPVKPTIEEHNPPQVGIVPTHTPLTPEEKTLILARVEEVGATQASRESGISKNTINNWRRVQKQPETAEPFTYGLEPAVDAALADSPIVKALINRIYDLKTENIILKERVAILTQKIDNLRDAITKLINIE